ncbi:MAG: flavin reductase [Oceanococcaceae bacterium]
MALDPEDFKAVMGQWPSGVTVVTTADAEGPAGMTASSFSSVSLQPPLVSICVARHLYMHQRLQQAGHFAVNILSKDGVQDGLRFAGMLPGVEDRFAGIETQTAVTGSPLLKGTLGWVDCRTWATYDGGDHTIFVGEVLDAGIEPTAAPLLYHSRSWGQFADVLASEVRLTLPGAVQGAVLGCAFGQSQPDSVETIVGRAQKALQAEPEASRLVLDDLSGMADPLLLRLTVQSLAGVIGKTRVVFRPGASPLALANVLVALKSGIHELEVSAEAKGPYLPRADILHMLQRMGVAVKD